MTANVLSECVVGRFHVHGHVLPIFKQDCSQKIYPASLFRIFIFLVEFYENDFRISTFLSTYDSKVTAKP